MTTEEAIQLIESRNGMAWEFDHDLAEAAKQLVNDYKAAVAFASSLQEPRRKLPRKVPTSRKAVATKASKKRSRFRIG